MSVKSIIRKIYLYPFVSKERAKLNEQNARNCEWNSIKGYIGENSRFLDIGCAEGYLMQLAKDERGCSVKGVEPQSKYFDESYSPEDVERIFNIYKGYAEDLPFNNNEFDVVYCSHLLEHITDSEKCFSEIKRVLETDGILIVGVPTATMAIINFFTFFIFAMPYNAINYVFYKQLKVTKPLFREIFIPNSHSDYKKTVFSDIFNYRQSKWQKKIRNAFKIVTVIKPCLYPYHEYRQLFKLKKMKRFSSSIFFICSKY